MIWKRKDDGKKERPAGIDFDIILDKIGSCGRYQILLICFIYYSNVSSGLNQIASVFLQAVPEHRCKVPAFDDNHSFYFNITEEKFRSLAMPYNNKRKRYESCVVFSFANSSSCSSPECLEHSFSNVSTSCTNGYIYNKTEYISTVATEWNLVCDRLWIDNIVRTVYFVGSLIGVLVVGNMSDRFGRTNVVLICQLLSFLFGMWISYSSTLWSYALARFFIAVITLSASTAAFIYAMEIIGQKSRTVVGILIQAVFALGYMTLSGFSFYWRDWRSLQRAIAIVPLAFPLLWIFLPKSPRWLFSKNRTEEGKEICYKMAKRNGRTLPRSIWQEAQKINYITSQHFSPLELYKRPYMKAVTLRLMFIWFTTSLVYYGLSLNVGSLSGDDRVNNILGGICELFSLVLAIFTMDRIGRKLVLVITFFISGVACVGSAITNQFAANDNVLPTVGRSLALLGKLAVSCTFAVIYNYTAEVFPTVLRGTGVGVGSMSARSGSICSSLYLLIDHSLPWLTGVTFGILSLIAGILTLQLPETMNVPLLTTQQQAEEFYRKQRKVILVRVPN